MKIRKKKNFKRTQHCLEGREELHTTRTFLNLLFFAKKKKKKCCQPFSFPPTFPPLFFSHSHFTSYVSFLHTVGIRSEGIHPIHITELHVCRNDHKGSYLLGILLGSRFGVAERGVLFLCYFVLLHTKVRRILQESRSSCELELLVHL